MEYKPGFLLKIHHYENDSDGDDLTEYVGLSIDEVKFYIELAKLFDEYGNSYCDDVRDDLNFDIYQIVDKFRELITIPIEWDKDLNDDPEVYWDSIHYLMGGFWNDYRCLRVFNKFEVYYIPDVNIENVTKNFS